MARPPAPDAGIKSAEGSARNPWEYESELAKYKAISDFIAGCGELSDVTDKFHHYESRWITLNRKSGLARPYRIGMYRYYKKNSLNHLRMAVNEIVRLLSQPKIILHGSDFVRDDYKEPGFFASVVNGAKKMLGLGGDQPQQRPQGDTGGSNGRY